MKNTSSSSYEEDGREFLSGFLDSIQVQCQDYKYVILPPNISEPQFNLSSSELNSFYNVCSYILQSITKTSKTLGLKNLHLGIENSLNTVYWKDFENIHYFFVMKWYFAFFLDMESIFKKYSIVSSQNINLKEFFLEQMSKNINIDKYRLP